MNGVYQPIEINREDDAHLWAHSSALGLDVCWEDGHLRWRVPETGRYLETHEEEAEGRIAAESRAAAAEARIRELEEKLRRRGAP